MGNIGKSVSENLDGYLLKTRRLREAISWHTPHLGGLRVLEVGCGIGMMASGLIDSGCIYTGLDISPDALESARARAPKGVFVLADAYNYALESAFDVVFCTDVLLHLVDDRNWLAAIRKMRDHLVYDGSIIIKEEIYSERRNPSPHVVSRSWTEYVGGCAQLGLSIQALDTVPKFYLIK